MPRSRLYLFIYAIPVARISQTFSELVLGEHFYFLYCKPFCIWTGLWFESGKLLKFYQYNTFSDLTSSSYL